MKKIIRADLKLGEPLPFSIFDRDGRLLLRQGLVLSNPDHIGQLIDRGVLKGENVGGEAENSSCPPVESLSVYERMGGLILNLKHIFTTALKSPEQIDLPARINHFAANLQALCQEDMDGALAAMHLDNVNPYIVVHQIMGATLTEVIAGRKGLTVSERRPFVCAALTRDIGQLGIQNDLDKCEGPLSESLKEAMVKHPLRGAEMLSRAGVKDNAWLHAVKQHHERFDGGGYPQKLRGDDITWGGGVLAITDMYSAMTKPRPYRNKAHFPQNALRDMYLGKDQSMDGELVQTLIKEIGMFPPGSIVRLKNGEIAVIKNCTNKVNDAVVFSVYDQKGMPLLSPIRREAWNADFEITGMVPFSECRSAAVTIKRLWIK
ncbi:MAG: HD domain-containing protein [Sulfuricella sp.]|nr:HD domain-containing protein [Sulfuricella sp.]